jgi:co-chaperonin GroES (HSP10)
VVDNSKIGSILIAEKYREISNRGTVIGVGHKVEGITAGDIVLFGLHDSETLTLRDEEFLLVRVGDVRGVERAL